MGLYNCPKLKELPSLPTELKSLRIYRTGWTTLNFRSNSNPIPLETLYVYNCPNITSLHLADEIARLEALRELTIRDCPNLISLGEMQTSNNCHLILNNLWISDPLVLLMEPLRSIASLKKLTIEFSFGFSFPNEAEQLFLKVRSSLCELQFKFLKSLQFLPSSLESLSSLQKLYIKDVPMLWELPHLPSSLEYLQINEVPMLRELPHLPSSLEYLQINDAPMLRKLPHLPSSLEYLQINDVPMLRELPNLPPSLTVLNISKVPMLPELPNLPPSLTVLNISKVPMLRELPDLPSSLTVLNIYNVPMLRELPNLPPSLERLRINGKCHPELKERYREDGGSDRHKIAHIPHIYIDPEQWVQ
ncbi:uncharacterized protein LOC110110932, partial [Dendrobium catenatum]|uniref:uncharacterized protein LOC110110932 n=1 Tax=Dendrobium catenatum TaxID=906689 RepID=UPI0010A0238D